MQAATNKSPAAAVRVPTPAARDLGGRSQPPPPPARATAAHNLMDWQPDLILDSSHADLMIVMVGNHQKDRSPAAAAGTSHPSFSSTVLFLTPDTVAL